MNGHRASWHAAASFAATAIALHVTSVGVLFAAPPTAGSIDVPAFATNVRVSVDETDLALSDAIRNAASDDRVVTYRQLRAEAGSLPDGQQQLARWCRKQKLAEEERLHWRMILMAQPGQPDAMKGLGLRMYDGRMLTKDEIDLAKKDAKLAKDAERKWGPKLKQIKLALEQGDAAARQAAVDELEAIGDPRVLALVERTFADQPVAALLVVEMYARAITQQANALAAKMNLRIDAALREAAKVDAAVGMPAKVEKAADVRPRLWWDWWQKRLNLNNYFAKGTEVWTKLGILPVEEIMVGDRVLTKNLDTGKLTFNLVIGIDAQPNREVTTVEVGGRTIVATPDQPLFVTGENWRSAAELKAGAEVESLAGPQRIETARSGIAGLVYSLLVADSPNYFVDREGILVHDATRK